MKWVKFRSTQNRIKAAETEKWEIREEENSLLKATLQDLEEKSGGGWEQYHRE